MGSVGTSVSSTPDEFNGVLGNRAEQTSADFLQMISERRKPKDVNPHYGEGKEYETNCALCAVATALQLRGYDVEAMPRDKQQWRGWDSVFDVDWNRTQDYMIPDAARGLTGIPHAWTLQAKGIQPDITPRGANAVANEVIKKAEQWGDGGNGYLAVKWKYGNSAHGLNVVNSGGEIVLYDGQSHRVVARGSEQIKRYLSRTIANHTGLIRLDNATVKASPSALDKIVKKHSGYTRTIKAIPD